MDSGKAQYLYSKFAPAMAYVAVEGSDGTPGIGSAFHVGEGVFVTARHVVENKRITEVAMTEHTYIRLEGDDAIGANTFVHATGGEEYPAHRVDNGVLNIKEGPFFHPNPNVDVAAFKVAEIDARTPYVNLGDHLDDWMGASDFVLAEVIVLGYPPIPMTKAPHLVAARAEVNAQVDLWGAEYVHFIVSSMPRGGFSGGLAVTENEVALGVITSSLLPNDREPEFGFFTVLSVEPIYHCLAHSKMVPEHIDVQWEGFWNEELTHFVRQVSEMHGEILAITYFYDGPRGFYIDISGEPSLLEAALRAVSSLLEPDQYRLSESSPDKAKIEFPKGIPAEVAQAARKAAEEVFITAGLTNERIY